MKFVKQPLRSKLCGQACLAMLLDIELEAAINVVGKTGKTTMKDLAKPLRYAVGGYKVHPTKRISYYTILDGRFLLKVKWLDGRTHWVVMDEGIIYDPSLNEPLAYDSFIAAIHGRITSYVKLER